MLPMIPIAAALAVARFDLEDVQFGLLNLGGLVLLVVFAASMLVLRKVFRLEGVPCCDLYSSAARARPVVPLHASSDAECGNHSVSEAPLKECLREPVEAAGAAE
jgi:hypothetical protein